MKAIVSCGQRGTAVIYGTLVAPPVSGQPVEIRDARMILEWSSACGGLLGLAARGPAAGTRITAAVGRTVASTWTDWTEVSESAAAAIDAWRAV